MNNLMKFIDQCDDQTQIIKLLKRYDVFDYVCNYLMDNHDVDFDGSEFINEQYPLELFQIKAFVNEAIYFSIHSF